MNSVSEVLKNKVKGLHYGNRILLPFQVHILKVVVENDIIMDFSCSGRGAEYNINDEFTEIYFHDFKNLEDVISRYETIKLVVVEKGNDIFELGNHKKLALHIKDQHKLEIEEINNDIMFID